MRAFDLVWRAFGRGLRSIPARASSAFWRAVVLAALLVHALGLGFEIGRVVALIGNAAAAVEFEDPAGDIVEEIAVVGDDQHRARIFAQMLFQPGRWSRRRDGWSARRAAAGRAWRSSNWQSATRRRSPPERLVDGRLARRAAERLHRHLDLAVRGPTGFGPVHLVLELGALRRPSRRNSSSSVRCSGR